MIYFFYMHTIIRQKYMVLFYLSFFCAQPFDQKSGPSFISFFFFARNHSTKIYDLLSFSISFVYDHWTKNRIYTDLFLLFARNRSTKICGLHLFFLLWTTIGPKIRVLIDLILFICTWLCTTIQPKIRVFIDIFISFAHNHSTKKKYMVFFLSFILSLCTTIRPKIRVLINLLFLFAHDHWLRLGVTLTH